MYETKTTYEKTKWFFGKKIEIPKTWNIMQIQDLAHINPEHIKDNYKHKIIQYIDIASIQDFQIKKFDSHKLDERPSRAQQIVEYNDVIVSTVRPYLNAFSLIDFDKSNLICSTGFAVVRAKIPSDSTFLFNYFKSHVFKLNYTRQMEGLAYPAITSSAVSNAYIPAPNNPDERKKIASILSRVDATIEKTQQKIEETERLKKGLMAHLLTRGIGHTKFKKTQFQLKKELKIPNDWKITLLENISKKIVSGGTPLTTSLEYWNGKIPWTRSSVLIDTYLKSGEKFITNQGLKNSASVLIPKNNLLVSSRVSVGNLSINVIDIAISQDITGIVIDKSSTQAQFLYWYLKQHIKKLVSISQGTTIQGFTRKELSTLPILLPPLHEQSKIASILSGVDAYIQKNHEYKKKLEELKKGLMQKLLTGQLRVKI